MNDLVSWRELEFMLEMNRERIKQLSEQAPSFYDPFDVRKKNGDWRHIDNPKHALKTLQDRIHKCLLRNVRLPENMIGGVTKRSARMNALAHVGQKVLVKLDLLRFDLRPQLPFPLGAD